MSEEKPIKTKRNKGGRPKLPPHELRKHKIEIWLSDVELADFEMMRQSTNLTRADLLRALIEKKRIQRVSVPEINRQTYARLGQIGNNINQLARAANQQGFTKDACDNYELHQVIQELRAELMGASE